MVLSGHSLTPHFKAVLECPLTEAKLQMVDCNYFDDSPLFRSNLTLSLLNEIEFLEKQLNEMKTDAYLRLFLKTTTRKFLLMIFHCIMFKLCLLSRLSILFILHLQALILLVSEFQLYDSF